MTSFKKYLRRILPAIFLTAMLCVLPSCRYLKQKLNLGEYSLKSAIEWAKRDSARMADSLKRVMEDRKVLEGNLPDSMKKELSDKQTFERTITDSLMSVAGRSLPAVDAGPGYYIITGSFANHDNALLAAAKYSGQGFKPSIIIKSGTTEGRIELVSVKTFSDYKKAQAFLNGFKGMYDPGAWIYTSN